jgi:hypothetical protein
MTKITTKITTGFNELPYDTKSGLAEIRSLLNVALCAINLPEDFADSDDVIKANMLSAYVLADKMCCDKEKRKNLFSKYKNEEEEKNVTVNHKE